MESGDALCVQAANDAALLITMSLNEKFKNRSARDKRVTSAGVSVGKGGKSFQARLNSLSFNYDNKASDSTERAFIAF
jgi:hypothetical protein